MKDNKKTAKYGVYVGRFCPVHANHEQVIREMLREFGYQKSLVVIGSSNAPATMRNIFNYSDRRHFLKTIFPKLRVVGLPDYNHVPRWLEALDDVLLLAGINPEEAVYYGGCAEDIAYFIENKREVKILDRHAGKYVKMSATLVRGLLAEGRPSKAKKYLNPLVRNEVERRFKERYHELMTAEVR